MYQFYPTLLDAFVRYKGSAEYAKAKTAYKELIDKINRVEVELPERVMRGKRFKEVLDELVSRGEENWNWLNHVADDYDYFISNTFNVKAKVMYEFCKKFEYSVMEHFTEGILPTKYGDVRLYGYVDNVLKDCGYDVKYVENYSLAKYFSSVQRLLYPYCLKQEGMGIQYFEFWATNGREIFVETYSWKEERDVTMLKNIVEEFVEFIELNRPFITDRKIFGQEVLAST